MSVAPPQMQAFIKIKTPTAISIRQGGAWERGTMKTCPLKDNIVGLFQGNRWGLYIILGFVTVILMGLVVKLFPKSPDIDETKQ